MKTKKAKNLKIDKGLPIPRPTGGATAHPESFTTMIEKLEVGDSFFTTRRIHNLAASRYQLFAKTGLDRQFTTRSVIEKGVAGHRIWRTA